MRTVNVQLQTSIHDSFRVRQVAGMFDLPVRPTAGILFGAEIPDESDDWQIGLIVGPSGSGKTSIARAAFGSRVYQPADWPTDKAVIDCLGDHPIKQITRTLTAVGFSSPPSWVKPYGVLSTGEKFRCDLARALLGSCAAPSTLFPPLPSGEGRRPALPPKMTVFDEFTSVVDRTVARIGSAAISKAVRIGLVETRFVAVTCHYDVLRWLQPDWVLDMSGPSLCRGRLRRPPIVLEIRRVSRALWPRFARHHYLTGMLHRSSQCFAGFVEGQPAAFTAVLPFPHPIRPGWREHRTVCLPDFQGVGIGTALSEFIASLFIATGKPYFSTTSHPAMIHHRTKSELWKMIRKPGMTARSGVTSAATTGMSQTNSRGRNTAGFEYVGPPRTKDARKFGIV